MIDRAGRGTLKTLSFFFFFFFHSAIERNVQRSPECCIRDVKIGVKNGPLMGFVPPMVVSTTATNVRTSQHETNATARRLFRTFLRHSCFVVRWNEKISTLVGPV